ncbi:MAG: SDR family oxidoreductase [Actinobacteria bacterium]|nr:SDR family oxidoreductase [Actinomycetota bacterium]
MGILDRFALHGRVALVTAGAGPLFGSSIAEALAEAGATVVTASRSLERNQTFAARLRAAGHDAHGMQVDITDVASIQRLHDGVMARFGRLDVLVNSALAREAYAGGWDEMTVARWTAAAAGDMVGLYAICHAFVADMVRQGRGSIVNIGSIFSVVANDPTMYEGTSMKQPPAYPFVKAGMVNFTRYIAAYFGKQGVRANCICPGGYFNHQPQPFLGRYEKRCPLGRMLNHEDLKGAVVFLASDASAYVTGHALVVDGGWTII